MWSQGDSSGGAGNSSMWPNQAPGGGGLMWPGGTPGGAPGGGGAYPGTQPGGPSNPTWPPSGQQPSQHGGWPNPSFGPGPGPSPGAQQLNPKVPFCWKIPSQVHDNMEIIITGMINSNAEKFTVDLSSSDNIAFHFKPHFNHDGKKMICRNSCTGGQWGKAETSECPFPFIPGQRFQIKICCTNNEFKVFCGGSHLVNFPNRRGNLSCVDTIGIYNDVSLERVEVH